MGRMADSVTIEENRVSVDGQRGGATFDEQGLSEIRANIGRSEVEIDRRGFKQLTVDLAPSLPSIPGGPDFGFEGKIERLDDDQGYQTTFTGGGGGAEVSFGLGGEGIKSTVTGGPTEGEGTIEPGGAIRLNSRTQIIPGGDAEASTDVSIEGCSISVNSSFFGHSWGFELTSPSCTPPPPPTYPPDDSGQDRGIGKDGFDASGYPEGSANCTYRLAIMGQYNGARLVNCQGFVGGLGYIFESVEEDVVPPFFSIAGYTEPPPGSFNLNFYNIILSPPYGVVTGAFLNGAAYVTGGDFDTAGEPPGPTTSVNVPLGGTVEVQGDAINNGGTYIFYYTVFGTALKTAIQGWVETNQSLEFPPPYDRIDYYVWQRCSDPLTGQQGFPQPYPFPETPPPSPSPGPDWGGNKPRQGGKMKDAACCSMLRKLVKFFEVEEIQKNGFKIPKRLQVAGGEGHQTAKSWAEIQSAMIRIADHLGVHPFNFSIKDTRSDIKGNQTAGLEFASSTQALQAMTSKLWMSEGKQDTLLNFLYRLSVLNTNLMLLCAKQSADLEAIKDALGGDFEPETGAVTTPFNIAAGVQTNAKKEEPKSKGFGNQQGKGKKEEKPKETPTGAIQYDPTKIDPNILFPEFLTPRNNPIGFEKFSGQRDITDLLNLIIIKLESLQIRS